MDTRVISSFVAPDDVNMIWNILERIKNNTLKNKIDFLHIYGGHCSGKTVLMNILEQLSPTFGHYSKRWYNNHNVLELNNKDVIFIDDEDNVNLSGSNVNTLVFAPYVNVFTRTLYLEASIPSHPKLFVIFTNKTPDILEKNAFALHLPYHFPSPHHLSTLTLVKKGVKEIHDRCAMKQSFVTFYGVLRRRFKLFGVGVDHIDGRIPCEIVQVLSKWLWSTRFNEKWFY